MISLFGHEVAAHTFEGGMAQEAALLRLRTIFDINENARLTGLKQIPSRWALLRVRGRWTLRLKTSGGVFCCATELT
jgi:hypothetical protein